MIKKVLFWGAKFKAGIIYDLIKNKKILSNEKKLLVNFIFDPNLSKPKFISKAKFSNRLRNLSQFIKKSDYFVTCIGNEFGMARYLISKELEKKIKPLSIISKTSYISNKNLLGKGVQLFPKSIVNYNASVGDYSILNTNSILEHDSKIGNGVHLMPGSVVGGNSIIEDYVTIGMNATVMPNIKIERGSYIGAGAVVTKNVKKNQVMIGNPARFLKKINHKVDIEIFNKLF